MSARDALRLRALLARYGTRRRIARALVEGELIIKENVMTWHEYADLWIDKHLGEPRELDAWEQARYACAILEWNEADSDKRRQLEQEVNSEAEI